MLLHHKIIHHVRSWYARFERPISSFSLLAGFAFDAITLHHVDHFWDNFWVGGHLIIVAICIIWINRREIGEQDSVAVAADPLQLHFWLVNIMQFFFGGLLSAFLVLYFRSAVFSVAWPFLLILVIAFFANESLKRQYARLYFQIDFLFFSVFLFAIFIIPVVMHSIGITAFLISGGTSLLLLAFFLLLLKRFSRRGLGVNKMVLFSTIAAIFVGMNILYFTNLIPPLPLSLEDAGVFHSISRDISGNYSVTYEDGGFLNRFAIFFGWYPTYHISSSEPAYVWSAIFSPAGLDLHIVHEWQEYDISTKQWITKSLVPLSVVGGRENGYRTYSEKAGITDGTWRVNIKTDSGELIGRLVFAVVTEPTPPVLFIETK